MFGYYPFWDSTYVLVIIGAILSMIASSRVKSTFAKYDKVRARSALTGARAAEMILRNHGIYDVEVKHINGQLTDCYVPSKKVLNLSDSTYNSTSIAAIGVAAHECGHAIQHAVGYAPLTLSNMIHPACAIGSNLAMPILIIGILLSMPFLVELGILLFLFAVIFQVITLPVEYNASNRALATLGESGMLNEEELVGTKKVLRAAGLTYVAALAASLLSLLRLVLIANRNRD
ncbi:MAG: zinc metallopeptidase [Candidatus Avilachnospira sp.]|jgi:Zn-dependent membrane protease YugP